MPELLDLTTWMAEDDLEDEAPAPEPAPDPRLIPPSFMPGCRTEPTRQARVTLWAASCAVHAARDRMLPSDASLMTALIYEGERKRTDLLTLKIDRMAELSRLPRSTVRDSLARLCADHWLFCVERGKPGKGGSGKAGKWKVTGGGLARRRARPTEVVGRPLRGRAKPDHSSPPQPRQLANPHTDESTIHLPRSIDTCLWATSTEREKPENEARMVRPEKPDTTCEKPDTGRVRNPKTDPDHAVQPWLLERLTSGPSLGSEVLAEGKSRGFSQASIYRARTALGVTSEKVGIESGGGRGKPPAWVAVWSLPEAMRAMITEPPADDVEDDFDRAVAAAPDQRHDVWQRFTCADCGVPIPGGYVRCQEHILAMRAGRAHVAERSA